MQVHLETLSTCLERESAREQIGSLSRHHLLGLHGHESCDPVLTSGGTEASQIRLPVLVEEPAVERDFEEASHKIHRHLSSSMGVWQAFSRAGRGNITYCRLCSHVAPRHPLSSPADPGRRTLLQL